MKDKKIVDAAVQFVKAYRRQQINGEKDPVKAMEEVQWRIKDIIKAVDEKYGAYDELTVPDLERCQGQKREGSFMTLGPRNWARCNNKPTFIAKENEPGSDGKIGSMSLCDECVKVFSEAMGKSYATLTPIDKEGK